MIRFLLRLLLALLAERLCKRLRPKPRYRFVLKARVFWAPVATDLPPLSRPDHPTVWPW